MPHNEIFDISDALDFEEKETKLTSLGVSSTINTKECISTGLLSLDLIIGGGLQRGRAFEIVGPEHGGKTTLLYSCFGQALKQIPNKLKGIFLDIEGLIDPKWFGHIAGYSNMDEIFGKKDLGNKWVIPPQIRYYKPTFGEQGLKFIRRILRRLPDKVLIGDTWHYMWIPVTPKVAKKAGGYPVRELQSLLKGKYSKKLYNKFGNFSAYP